MKLLRYLPLFGSLLFSSISFAASTDFVDNDWYTSDRLSGLDWLDVTLTTNMTYDDVTNNLLCSGCEYDGWRYATGDEFNTLVSDYTNNTIALGNYGEVNQEADLIDGLVVLLGSTLDVYYLDSYGQTYDALNGYQEGEGIDYTWGLLSDTSIEGYHYIAMIRDNDVEGHWQEQDMSFAHHRYTSNFDKIGYMGSYLVRGVSAVPVPAAMWLFAPAMLGFVGLRRKVNRA